MTHFIYHPRSGDRVFVEAPGPNLAIARWPNGCRHVLGGVRLEFQAAAAGSWWRDKARDLVTQIVALAGQGIGWDDGGMINVILLKQMAYRAWELIEEAIVLVDASAAPGTGTSVFERRRNRLRLVLAGCANLASLHGDISPAYVLDPPPTAEMIAGVRYKDLTPTSISGGESLACRGCGADLYSAFCADDCLVTYGAPAVGDE